MDYLALAVVKNFNYPNYVSFWIDDVLKLMLAELWKDYLSQNLKLRIGRI